MTATKFAGAERAGLADPDHRVAFTRASAEEFPVSLATNLEFPHRAERLSVVPGTCEIRPNLLRRFRRRPISDFDTPRCRAASAPVCRLVNGVDGRKNSGIATLGEADQLDNTEAVGFLLGQALRGCFEVCRFSMAEFIVNRAGLLTTEAPCKRHPIVSAERVTSALCV